MAYVNFTNLVLGEDGDSDLCETLHIASIVDVELDNSNSNNLDELDGSFEGDGVEDLTILRIKTRQIVVGMVYPMVFQVISYLPKEALVKM